MKYRLFVSDNIKHSYVFEEDQQIKEFLVMIEDFQGTKIDQDGDEVTKNVEVSDYKKSIANKKIIQLKDNVFTRGLVPLERLYSSNDVAVGLEKFLRMNRSKIATMEPRRSPS